MGVYGILYGAGPLPVASVFEERQRDVKVNIADLIGSATDAQNNNAER
jgi:hypothetical protein